MKINILTLVFMFVSNFVFAQGHNDWAQFGKFEESNKQVSNPTVVFMGNSITEGWWNQDPNFFTTNNYVSRGISGQVTSQMLVRFQSDVIQLKPKTVVILAGTNDIALNNGYISLQHIFENIVSMAELAKAHKIKVVLCSITPVHHYPWRKEVTTVIQDIKTLNGMLQTYAKKNKIAYADYYSAMVDEREGMQKDYQKDEVHPNLAGYKIMEEVINKILKK